MNHIRKLHEEAMDLAEMAFVARLKGDLERAVQLSRQAYEGEAQAAKLMSEAGATEPTRSVLYRSAASLALNCNEFREAERLIAAGLAGDPPEEIAEELRDLYEKVNFQRSALPQQLETIVLELDRMQKENEELKEKLRTIGKLIPDDRSKIEGALYRNPLQSIGTLLMISGRDHASLKDIEEICHGKVLEVLHDCIKNDLIQSSDGELTLTPLGVQSTLKWQQTLQQGL